MGYIEQESAKIAIFNATGLTVDAMNAIRKITGTEKDCLSFGYEAGSCRSILNALFSSSLFINPIEYLHELDSAVTDPNNKGNGMAVVAAPFSFTIACLSVKLDVDGMLSGGTGTGKLKICKFGKRH